MFTVIYEFKIKPGSEKAFEKSWRDLTNLIYNYEGSLGSRLHKLNDEIYLAYAQWPDRVTWVNAGSKMPAESDTVRKIMGDSCEHIKTLHELPVVDDLLRSCVKS